jgi:hypothetical protein
MKITPPEHHIANIINRCYAQEGLCKVPRIGIWHPQDNLDWKYVRKILLSWREKGWIDIVNDPEYAQPNEICIELHVFLDTGEKFPDNWIRDRG